MKALPPRSKPAARTAWRMLLLAAALPLAGAPGPARAVDAPGEEPVYLYTATRGDTLIGVGRRLLADPSRWPELAKANALINPNRIGTGIELRIPLRLMRSTSVAATLVSVTGQAQGAAPGALQAGQPVPEGSPVSTGPDGHVTIRLVDGTLLRLRPDSRLQLRESRELKDAGVVRSGARLDRGRVEVEATPARPGRAGFSIDTPQGVLGVRGTEFRVAVETAEAAEAPETTTAAAGTAGAGSAPPAPRSATYGEVLSGVVAMDGRSGSSQRVGAGYGSVVDAGGRVAAPVALLPAPDTSGLPTLQERLLMRFPLPAMAGATRYRGQVASDSRFDRVLADLTSRTPELRFADLPDGDYVLRVRAIDSLGLEGLDADHRFRLKARPEAPLPAAPQPRAIRVGSRADFSWAANAEADHYRLQLAAAPDFKAPLRDLGDLRQLATQMDGLQPGVYHWRLASVRADGDQGPWGDPRSFELRPPPPAPKPPAVGDDSVAFAWEASPGQTFEFQVARDAAFSVLVLQRRLTQPGITLPLPGTGRFYVRLRTTDPDGFVGPYATAQYFDVPNCLRDGSGACVRAGEDTLQLTP
jgi:hypothetical protein